MKVTFVLPGGASVPAGGSRMIFRYANALAQSGWSVTVVMPSQLKTGGPLSRFLRLVRFWVWRITRGYSPHRWMKLDSGVKLLWVRNLAAMQAPGADVVVATAVQTAEAVAGWPRAAGKKFYFVQGYETWDFPAARVESSWRLPLEKIAVSRWLCDLIAGVGERAAYLPNGLDHETFGLDQPIDDRRVQILLWPYHPIPQKGSADVISVLQQLLRDQSKIEVHAFGTARPPDLPGLTLHYHRNPSQTELRRLYNSALIAIAPSHAEGWGLPACEALQCGCALVATAIGGHQEFLRDEQNSLLYRPGDAGGLEKNLRRLLADDSLRRSLAKQGVADMAGLRFEAGVERLKQLLTEGTTQ